MADSFGNSPPRALVHLVAVVLVPLAALGCRSMSGRGPMSRSVATCQQFAQQGRSAVERNDWEKAETLLAQAVQACGNDVESRRHYAETLWHRGATQEALAQLKEAQRLAPDDGSLIVRAGEMQLASGAIEEGRQAAERGLNLDPRCPAAWALHGRALQAAGDLRGALADYQRSLGYAPNNPEVLLDVAEVYRQLGQPERALVSLQNLLDHYAPGEEPQKAIYLQGLAYAALGRYNEAIASYTQANTRGSPTAEILCRLGEAQHQAGRAADARASLLQALTIDPQHGPSLALMQRIDIAVRQGPPLH